MSMMDVYKFSGWMHSGERGISSEAIVTQLTGLPIGGYRSHDWPHDVGDFRRCQLLLETVPEARFFLGEMRQKSFEWAALVDHWDEIVALMDEEFPQWRTRPASGSAPKAYKLIRGLLDAERGRTSQDVRP